MSRQMTITTQGVGPSNTFGVDINITPVNVGFGVELSPGATLTFNIEHTYHDLWTAYKPEDVTWFPFLTNQSANVDGYYGYPISGFRLNITSWTSGTATIKVLQAGI
jgi:hypothetical protein